MTATAVKGDAPDFTSATTYAADTWTNKDVKVTFDCEDNAGGSGLTSASGDQVKTFTTNTTATGATATFDGTCKDNAGNAAAASNFGPIKIDKGQARYQQLGQDTARRIELHRRNVDQPERGSQLRLQEPLRHRHQHRHRCHEVSERREPVGDQRRYLHR